MTDALVRDLLDMPYDGGTLEEWEEHFSGKLSSAGDVLSTVLEGLDDRFGRGQVLRLLARAGCREVIEPARAELAIDDEHQYSFAAALARLGESDGHETLARISRANLGVVDAMVPESWIVEILEDIGSPQVQELLKELTG